MQEKNGRVMSLRVTGDTLLSGTTQQPGHVSSRLQALVAVAGGVTLRVYLSAQRKNVTHSDSSGRRLCRVWHLRGCRLLSGLGVSRLLIHFVGAACAAEFRSIACIKKCARISSALRVLVYSTACPSRLRRAALGFAKRKRSCTRCTRPSSGSKPAAVPGDNDSPTIPIPLRLGSTSRANCPILSLSLSFGAILLTHQAPGTCTLAPPAGSLHSRSLPSLSIPAMPPSPVLFRRSQSCLILPSLSVLSPFGGYLPSIRVTPARKYPSSVLVSARFQRLQQL
ncbi:hypothetical protein B0H19DRAFT_1084348 [Mycena capillaripes]|nr:hypothetical protein B0H19DRAFT_1084348 [Mycena capillaripes]